MRESVVVTLLYTLGLALFLVAVYVALKGQGNFDALVAGGLSAVAGAEVLKRL